MSRAPGLWVRRTAERPFAHKMRGVRYVYRDGKCVDVRTLNQKPSSIEADALKRHKKEAQ